MSKQKSGVRKVILFVMFLTLGLLYFLKNNQAKKVEADLDVVTSEMQTAVNKPIQTIPDVAPLSEPRQVAIKKSEQKQIPPQVLQNSVELQKREFLILRDKALQSIPTVQELRKLTKEQLHFTPESVLNAGLEIGTAAEYIDKHPELSDDGLDFYEKCATGVNHPTSIRASCYFDFNRLAKKVGSRRASPQVPEHVRNLAEKLL
jgi:hypothetical protein